jgi:hypothetical protein
MLSLARPEDHLATARHVEHLNADTRSRALRINSGSLWTISTNAMLIQRNPMKRSCDYSGAHRPIQKEEDNMSLGTILIIILIVALLGGFTGVVGGYGYGFGHGGVGVLGTMLIIVLILVLLGRL